MTKDASESGYHARRLKPWRATKLAFCKHNVEVTWIS